MTQTTSNAATSNATTADALGAAPARWRNALKGRTARMLALALAAVLVSTGLVAAGFSQVRLRDRLAFEMELRSHFTEAPVLIVGDSITYQAAPHSLCGEAMFNAGVPGDRLDDLIARSPALVERIHPERVVVAIGANDAARPHPDIAQWRKKYRALLAMFAASDLVLVEVNPVDPSRPGYAEMLDPDFMAQQNAAIRALAAEQGARVVPAPTSVSTYDGLHPTAVGIAFWRARLTAAACR